MHLPEHENRITTIPSVSGLSGLSREKIAQIPGVSNFIFQDDLEIILDDSDNLDVDKVRKEIEEIVGADEARFKFDHHSYLDEQKPEKSWREEEIQNSLIGLGNNLRENNIPLCLNNNPNVLYSIKVVGDQFFLKKDGDGIEVPIEMMDLAKSLVWVKADNSVNTINVSGDYNDDINHSLGILRSAVQHKLILEDEEDTFHVYESTTPIADFKKSTADNDLKSYFREKIPDIKKDIYKQIIDEYLVDQLNFEADQLPSLDDIFSHESSLNKIVEALLDNADVKGKLSDPDEEKKALIKIVKEKEKSNLRSEVLKSYIKDNNQKIKNQFQIIDAAIKGIDEGAYNIPEEYYDSALDGLKEELNIVNLTQFQKYKFEKGFFYAYFAKQKIDQLLSKDPKDVIRSWASKKLSKGKEYEFKGRVEIKKIGFTLGLYFYDPYDYKFFCGEEESGKSGGKAGSINGIPVVRIDASNDDIFFLREVEEHEWRHIRDNFLIPDKEQSAEDSRSRYKTEIIAYIKDGSSLKQIYDILTNPSGLYTYGKREQERKDYYKHVAVLLNSISKLDQVNLDALAIFPMEMWSDLANPKVMEEFIKLSGNSSEIASINKNGWEDFYKSLNKIEKKVDVESSDDLSCISKFDYRNFSNIKDLDKFVVFLCTEENIPISAEKSVELIIEAMNNYLERTKEYVLTSESDSQTIEFLVNETGVIYDESAIISYALYFSKNYNLIQQKFEEYLELRSGKHIDEIKGQGFERIESFHNLLKEVQRKNTEDVHAILAEHDKRGDELNKIIKILEKKIEDKGEINYEDIDTGDTLPIYQYSSKEFKDFGNVELLAIQVWEKYLELRSARYIDGMENGDRSYLLSELRYLRSFLENLYDLGYKKNYYSETEEKEKMFDSLGNFVEGYLNSRFGGYAPDFNKGRNIWEKFELAEKFITGEENLSEQDQDSVHHWDSYQEFHKHNQYKDQKIAEFQKVNFESPKIAISELSKNFEKINDEAELRSSFDVINDLLLIYIRDTEVKFDQENLNPETLQTLREEFDLLLKFYNLSYEADKPDQENYLSRIDAVINEYLKSRYRDYLYKFKGKEDIKMIRVMSKIMEIKKTLDLKS